MTIEQHRQRQWRLEDQQRALGIEIANLQIQRHGMEYGPEKELLAKRIERMQENHRWIMQQLNESYARFGSF